MTCLKKKGRIALAFLSGLTEKKNDGMFCYMLQLRKDKKDGGGAYMFSVAICDDDELLCARIENTIRSYMGKNSIRTEVYYSCEKLYDAIQNKEQYDLLFLDIELGLMNGVEMGNRIRNEFNDERTHIVYISAKTNYAMELFDVRPLNFLVKPFTKKQIIDVLNKAMELTGNFHKYFEFQTEQTVSRIEYGDIIYFESKSRKVALFSLQGKHEFYAQLNDIEQQTKGEFLRIHQSFLINPMYVKQFCSQKVVLNDDSELPISHAYRKVLRTKMLKRWESE
jgi:DNA-binding LytR/AlgR family response regulator